MPTVTVENYLKALYQLGAREEAAVPLGRLARELAVTPGTVTSMIQRLSGETGLVAYRRREGAWLTSEGEEAAMKVLRRHRIIELFLVNVVKLEWDAVHEEAEDLEHAMSDRLVERMAEMLGHPEYDPHGAPIPSANGRMPKEIRVPLSEASRGLVEVVGISDDSAAFKRFAQSNGLAPGARFEILEIDPDADILRLKCAAHGTQLELGSASARKIVVRCRKSRKG